MIKVAIIEDQKILRDGYKSLLKNREFEVVCEAAEGMAAIKCVLKERPDIILLDLSLPKMDGMAVLKEIRRPVIRSKAKVLVLTMHDSEEKVAEAFQEGADGFCLKDSSASEMVLAMEEILKGNRYISAGIAGQVVTGYLHRHPVENP